MSGGVAEGAEGADGAGVQVVRLGEGARRYELDEAALRRVLLRPDVRHLPAVVVSVAGAYRGGKSFILDFFLRYLNASRPSQLSGEWLGAEDEQLKGFHWRGGGERDTTGIHLWPHPIITTLRTTGEKVAVLLMDTQGTFDSETTMGQTSAIFALSTLISSMQIYNLSSNIREDDLQHLQLFTEYGKLACDVDGKAFQTLTFLVRDWPNAYEHAHGFEGGAALLAKRLQTNPNQKTELREVRDHIRSCFDKIQCFLMPHPGLTVCKQTFAGCIQDITEEFRTSLLELVPAIFDPEHLTPKSINGEPVKTEDLFEYFQKYVDIFNSDELPEATTIFKATADACLLAATRAARELYEGHMQAHVRDTVSVTGATLAAWHAAACNDAKQAFCLKKKLGSPADADAALDELIKEMEARLSLYKWDNDTRVRETMTLAKNTYDTAFSNVCGDHALICLHPQDLENLHAEIRQAALAVFDDARQVAENEEDDQRTELNQSLQQKFEHFSMINEQNNKKAVLEARNLYNSRMKVEMDQAGVSSERLEAQSRVVVEEAKALFARQRNRPTEHATDPFMEQLLQELSSCFTEFEKVNLNSYKIALQAAEYKYNNYMTSAWGPQTCCFHPKALQEVHEKGVQETLDEFLATRPENDDEEYREAVLEVLKTRYDELKAINEYNNARAVDDCVWIYTVKMDQLSQPSVIDMIIGIFVPKVLKWQPRHHNESKHVALAEFRKRRRGLDYDNDTHYNNLETMPSLNPARSLGPSFVLSRWDSHWVCWVGGLGGGVASALLHEWCGRRTRGGSSRASSPRDLDDLDKPTFPTHHHYRHAPTYCAAAPRPDTAEPLYSGTKSLYCRSPPPARHGLHRSQSVYSKGSSATSGAASSAATAAVGGGPLVTATSLVLRPPAHAHAHAHHALAHNQNAHNAQRDPPYGTANGIRPGPAGAAVNERRESVYSGSVSGAGGVVSSGAGGVGGAGSAYGTYSRAPHYRADHY